MPRHDCLPFAENFEVLHSRKQRVPSFIAAAKVRTRSRLLVAAPAPDACPPAQMARLMWGQQQGEQPEKRRRGDLAAPEGELEGAKRARSAGDADGFALSLAAARRSTGRRSKAKARRRPQLSGGRAAPAFRRLPSSVSLLGTTLDMSGLSRRLGSLPSRLGPLAAQAQESVAGRLRLLRSEAHADAPLVLADEELQERRRLLTQLETLAMLPRVRAAVCELEAAHAEAALPQPLEPYGVIAQADFDVDVDVQLAGDEEPQCDGAAADDTDTSATDVDDDD